MQSMTAMANGLTSPEILHFETSPLEAVQYSVGCLPARVNGVVTNWSLSQLDDHCFKERLLQQLPTKHTKTFYAPTVDRMSGVILPSGRFTTIFPLSSHVVVRRPGFKKNSDEKEACDGTAIGTHEGFVMSAGGCPLIILTGTTDYGDRLCLAAHAGRDCLIDKMLVQKGKQSRAYFSVIDALVEFARKCGAHPKYLTLRSFFSVPWQAFPHSTSDPDHGGKNAQLHFFLGQHRANTGIFQQREDGVYCLHLSSLIEQQAKCHSIGHIVTGLLDLPFDGEYAYSSHIQSELKDPVRNLVWVVRN